MAGGVGSRFWPVSRTNKPKQFLDILGTGKSLIRETFERFLPLFPVENFYIVTSSEYLDIVLEQIPELTKDQVLLEPMRRNTAPCIAYANYKILTKNPDANIVVTPADHLIIKVDEFRKYIQDGIDFVKNNDALLTLGIKPTRPDTGYGYIQVNQEHIVDIENDNLKKVKTFTEKPELEMAKFFLESGEFYWNSGIFLWSIKSIDKAFDNYLSDVNSLFKENIGSFNTKKEKEAIKNIYFECRNISIDYGVMEKASNVFVLCSDFGWSDLGTWNSVYEHSEKDKNQNVFKGKNIVTYNSKNNIIKSHQDKLIVVQGLDNYIIVESDNALLICKKDEEQLIRQFVNDIKINKGEEYI